MATVEAARTPILLTFRPAGRIDAEVSLNLNGEATGGGYTLSYDAPNQRFGGAKGFAVSNELHAALTALWDLFAAEVAADGEVKLAADFATVAPEKAAAVEAALAAIAVEPVKP